MLNQQAVHSIANKKLQLSTGAEVAYYDSQDNKGKATALVLLHGYCGSSAYWQRIIGELEEGIRVIVPDARGHGGSTAPNEDVYTMEAYASDLGELLQTLQVEKVIVIGHSLGGYIALAYAESEPDHVVGFGLVHSTPLPDTAAAKEKRELAVTAIAENGICSFVDNLIPKLFATDTALVHQAEIANAKEIGYNTSPHGAKATAKGMQIRKNSERIIKELQIPVLLVAGALDGVIPPSSTFVAYNEHTTKVEIEQVGHMSMLEDPQELKNHIMRFILSIEGENG